MKQLYIAATTLVLICASACAQQSKSKELAAQLLKTSELPVFYASGLSLGYRDSAVRDNKPEQEINCVMGKITTELVQPVLLDGYAREFSENELSQAISFFETKAGRDYIQSQHKLLNDLRSGSPIQPPEFPSPEAEQIEAFAHTRIGKPLIMAERTSFTNSIRDTLQPKIHAFFDECKAN